jgi:ribosomal protein S18 acetylase RimI-like enzyme
MFEIRKAVPDDALGIAIVNVYTWKTTYTGLMPDDVIDSRIAELRARAEQLKADIEANDNFYAAVAGSTVVGFCIYGPSRNEAFGDAGEIFALYVLKGFQGTGVGRALFSAGAAALLASGRRGMIVNCLAGNPALAFYRHMGGRIVGRRADELAGARLVEEILFFENPEQIT